jgi:hypothetical protein
VVTDGIFEPPVDDGFYWFHPHILLQSHQFCSSCCETSVCVEEQTQGTMMLSTFTVHTLVLLGYFPGTHGGGYFRGNARGMSKSEAATVRKLQAFVLFQNPIVNATSSDPEHLYPLSR